LRGEKGKGYVSSVNRKRRRRSKGREEAKGFRGKSAISEGGKKGKGEIRQKKPNAKGGKVTRYFFIKNRRSPYPKLEVVEGCSSKKKANLKS